MAAPFIDQARISVKAGDGGDGAVAAVGENEYGQCDVSDWTDIRVPDTGT